MTEGGSTGLAVRDLLGLVGANLEATLRTGLAECNVRVRGKHVSWLPSQCCTWKWAQ